MPESHELKRLCSLGRRLHLLHLKRPRLKWCREFHQRRCIEQSCGLILAYHSQWMVFYLMNCLCKEFGGVWGEKNDFAEHSVWPQRVVCYSERAGARWVTYGVLGIMSSSRLCYSLKMSLSTRNKSITASSVAPACRGLRHKWGLGWVQVNF